MTVVGRISSIHRYPVKSMGGERLAVAPLTLQGILGDRMYAFVQAGSRSVFPWFTGREAPSILSYSARMVPGERPAFDVQTPAGAVMEAGSPELLAELEALGGKPLNCLVNYRGTFDVAPASLLALSTVRAIAKESETADDPLRFRMNFYIDTGDDTPFVENAWVGGVLRLGESARIAVNEPDKRCVMITLDHQTSKGSPKILRAVSEMNAAAAGVYGVVVTAGEVREGDEVTLE
ncbi:MAG: MOSC domain-containing protein [Chloroflexi bacterium]|nr:MOSC domain-containing protein [Chloroflexota bacterium]